MVFISGSGSTQPVQSPVANRRLFAEAGSNVPINFPGTRSEDMSWSAYARRNRSNRDLPELTHDRMIALSFVAYRTNPLAHRLIEMQVNFVLGNGITITSRNPEILALISAWWNDPWNAWPTKIHRRLRDLYIYGEWIHRPLVNEESGFVYINDIQPDTIKTVETDPLNHSEIDALIFKQVLGEVAAPSGSASSYERRSDVRASIIRRALDPKTVTLGPWSGDVFFQGINRTTDSNRGIGELFPVLDYIDLYDEILISRAEKIQTMSQIYYDLTLEGMSEQEIIRYVANETNLPPKPGTVWAHNKSAEMNVIVPDLKADDHAVDVSVIKSFIISSMGWPGTWFDDPGSAGRAVGVEMAEPALKNIISLQTDVANFLTPEINYVLANAKQLGLITNTETEYAISFNRASARDIQRIGPALARLSTFLDTLQNKLHVLTPEEVRRLVISQINQLDLTDAPLEIELPAELKPIHKAMNDQILNPPDLPTPLTQNQSQNPPRKPLAEALEEDRALAVSIVKLLPLDERRHVRLLR